jgi:hypothetical protein
MGCDSTAARPWRMLRVRAVIGATIVLAVCAAAGVRAPSAAADSACSVVNACSYGNLVVDFSGCNGGCTLRGVRANIKYDTTITTHTGNIDFANVAAWSSSDTRIEVGYGRSNNPPADSCFPGSGGTKTYYMAIGQLGTKVCVWGATPAPNSRYSVQRSSGSCGTCWRPFIDGVSQSGAWDVTFDKADAVTAGPHLWDAGTSNGADDGTSITPTFGSGDTPWQRDDTVGGGNYVTIHQANGARNTDDDWDLPSAIVAGDPFTFRFTGTGR